MSPEAFVKPVVQAVTNLVKKRYEQWKLNTAIEQKMNDAFSQVEANIQVLCLDADFCRELFRLAEGETIDAEKLVALGTAIQRDGKPIVPEAALIADLKDFAYR